MRIRVTVYRPLLLFAFVLLASGADRTIFQFVHKTWTGKDGAPAGINAITQAADGYLWLASTQGLYRFDGIEFESYKPQSGDPLPAQGVYSLLAVPNGDLWVGFQDSGVSVLHNGINRNYTPADGLPTGRVQGLARDAHGSIWAATSTGLARFDGSKWERIVLEEGFKGPALGVYLDRAGTLWVSTSLAIFYLSPGASTFRPTEPPSESRTDWVSYFGESGAGTLWIAQTVRSVRTMPATSQGPEIKVGSKKFIFDREGALWITTLGDGIRRVPDPDRLTHEIIGEFDHRAEAFTTADGLSSDYCTSVFQDREGNIWIGTGDGIDRFTKGAVVPVPVPRGFGAFLLLRGTGGDVWVGSLSGRVGRIHGNQWNQIPDLLTANSAVSDPKGGTWWAEQNQRGARELNGKFTSFPFPAKNPERIDTTMEFALDTSGTLWLSGSDGIFARRDEKWQRIETPPEIAGKTGTAATGDESGRVWFAYRENTILVVDGPDRQVLSARDGLNLGLIKSIDVHGSSAWVAGAKGLQFFDGKHFHDVAPDGGATFGSVSGVLLARDGSLWLNAYRGIIRIPPSAVSRLMSGATSTEYLVLDAYDGLSGATQQVMPHPTLVQATDGRLWFATTGGPVWVDPNNWPNHKPPPVVALQALAANGRQYTVR